MIMAARGLGVLVAFYGVSRKCIQFILGALTVDAKKSDIKGSLVEKLRLAWEPNGGSCDEWKEQSLDQMRVHIASLVVHEGQADEDLPIVCLF